MDFFPVELWSNQTKQTNEMTKMKMKWNDATKDEWMNI